jgi:Cu/Ag efflux pump CusA
MTNRLVESSLRLRAFVAVIAAAVVVMGVMRIGEMPVDALPEFAPPYVEIQTEALGLSADEVEQLITVPMEEGLLNGVAWVDVMRSESVPGLSSIVLVFKPGTDLMRARQMVQERLTLAHALPKVSRPPAMLQPLSSTSRVMMVGLSSDELSLIEMSVLARWNIRTRLMGVPGVANVAIWGQRERQLQVQVDPVRLQERGVSLDQVVETAGNALWVSPLSFIEASTPGTGGFVDTANQRLGIRHVLPIRTAEDLAQVPLEGCSGGFPTAIRHVDANCPSPPQARPPFRLGEVATVVEDHQPLIGDAVVNGGPGLLLVIEKFPWANTVAVTRGVEEALEALKPGLKGMEIDPTLFRPASFIELSRANLALALLLGFLSLALVLVALLGARAALVAVAASAMSLLAAGLALSLLGATLNTLVVAGLVVGVGLVVNDAIADVYTIRRRLRERGAPKAVSAAAVISNASLEGRHAMIYATLIAALALVPVIALPGLASAFLQPLALAYALAVLASLAVALTVTPALSLLLLADEPLRREAAIWRSLRNGYAGALGWLMLRSRAAYGAAAVAGIASLALLPLLAESPLIVAPKQTELLIRWDGAPGTSHPEMTRITTQAAHELRAAPGVRGVGAHVGRAVMSDSVVGMNSSEIWVSLEPSADHSATLAAIQSIVDGYPGLRRDVQTYPEARLREVQTGASEEVVVRIYGPELDVLRTKAQEIRQLMGTTPGIMDPRIELQVDEPTIEIEVDLAAAQSHGLKPGDVRRTAATLVTGIEVGNLFEEQKVFDVVVTGTPDARHSLTSVRDLRIDTATGGQVRLDDVADVRLRPTPNVIKREAVSRRIDVGANVSGRDVGSVSIEIERRLHEVAFPNEYHAEVLRGYVDRQATDQRMLGFALAAAIGIFLLLQAAFGSWRLAAIVFLTLPAALAGGLIAAFAAGTTPSLASLVGLFAVIGIAARGTITLVDEYRRLERISGEGFGTGLITRGADAHLSASVTTALGTMAVLAPLVLLGNVFGQETIRPVAIVILGGVLTTTLVNLFVIPAAYFAFGPWPTFEPASSRAGSDPRPATRPLTS